MDNVEYEREVIWAWGAVAIGFVLAFMIWGGSDPMNFVCTWGPQVAILIVMGLLRARPAALAGAAFAMAGYLAFFKLWANAYHPNDGLVWLLYLFSMPGGLVAGIAAAVWFGKLNHAPALQAGLGALTLVVAGIAINQIGVQLALAT